MEFQVFVKDTETPAKGPSVNVKIPKGSNEAPFTIYLPARHYAIGYENNDFKNNGYEEYRFTCERLKTISSYTG